MRDKLILPEPVPNSNPSWFGFMLTCNSQEHTAEKRNKLTQYIEKNNIQTRTLFAGNIVKHPCFGEMQKRGTGYRVVGTLEATDVVLNNSFWIGVYPGMSDEMIDRMIMVVREGLFQQIYKSHHQYPP
jgi:CDP-6-deoxy-D-xylo-4-hexulose-3-dehydrase